MSNSKNLSPQANLVLAAEIKQGMLPVLSTEGDESDSQQFGRSQQEMVWLILGLPGSQIALKMAEVTALQLDGANIAVSSLSDGVWQVSAPTPTAAGDAFAGVLTGEVWSLPWAVSLVQSQEA